MRRLVIFAATLAAFCVSCGALKMDTAATVDGSVIDMSSVSELAGTSYITNQAQTVEGLVTTSDGRAGGATTRSALVFLIQNEVFKNGLEDMGLEVPEKATDQSGLVELYEADFLPFASYQQTLVDELAAALADLTGSQEELRSYYENHVEFFDQTCFDGVAIDAANADELRDAAADSERFSDLVADDPDRVFPLDPEGADLCLNESGVPPELSDAIFSTPVGELSEALRVADDGTENVYFIRPTRRGQLEFDDEVTQSQLGAMFQAYIGGDIGQWFSVEASLADVDVDPRIGEWSAESIGSILPPTVPTQKASAPTELGF